MMPAPPRPPLTTFAALLLGAALAAVTACAGAARAPATSAEPGAAAPPLGGRPDELRQQIAELDQAIDRDLAAAALERPDAAAAAAMAATPMAEVRLTCEHAQSERCLDVCKLSDSICGSAASICDLAAQLPGDAWAEERCGAAKASCQRATERCCAGECAGG